MALEAQLDRSDAKPVFDSLKAGLPGAKAGGGTGKVQKTPQQLRDEAAQREEKKREREAAKEALPAYEKAKLWVATIGKEIAQCKGAKAERNSTGHHDVTSVSRFGLRNRCLLKA
eukprot:10994032-Alexandrium_andersonii.AAC.1